MKRLLVQTQLSNYDTKGKFILECDSGWQMVIGRCREMLKLNPDLVIDVMGPKLFDAHWNTSQCITSPHDINPDMDWNYLYAYVDPKMETRGRLNYIGHEIIPNALATRYDFDFEKLGSVLGLKHHKAMPELKYDAVYVNDPMHLRNLKALFMVKGGYAPKFYVHSHFVDVPSCPKFPVEASLWLGQCEAAIKADYNFWQCESALIEFEREARKVFAPAVVDVIMAKSSPWDDGYSSTEINIPPNMKNVRFDPEIFSTWASSGKYVIFVPNRIGGRGRSSDYTNCGKFIFELLPSLRECRKDFIVIAGNPSQKFLNSELEAECGPNGYVSIVPDSLNRDEFKFVARNSDIALGLYDQDAYGGTVARECVDLGCSPLWLDNHEYSSIARAVGGYPLARPDWSDFVGRLSSLIDDVKHHSEQGRNRAWDSSLKRVVKDRCSYEATTPAAMKIMGLL